MDQIARYQSILEDQYYNPNNIDNYKLGINKLNDEDYEIIIGRNIDIYKTTIDKTTKLNGILKEYRSILYKFLVEKINEKSKLKSFIELVKINKKESININITLKTKYFFEKVELKLDKLTDDYFQKQIDETKLKTFVFEEYDDITDEDIEWYKSYSYRSEKFPLQDTLDKANCIANSKSILSLNNYCRMISGDTEYNKKEKFQIKYNINQIYISGDINLNKEINIYNQNNNFNSNHELYKYKNKIIFFTHINNFTNYKKFKLPINYNKVIVKSYTKYKYNKTGPSENQSYTIIIDHDVLIIIAGAIIRLDNLIFI